MSQAATFKAAGGEPIKTGRSYWIRFGPLQITSESYAVIAATVTEIDPDHRAGGPIKISYRTAGRHGAPRTGWRHPEELYSHRLAAAFVQMPSEEPVEW